MHNTFLDHVQSQIGQLRADGFYKAERVLDGPQAAQVQLADGDYVLNFCANNYLGLANDRRLIEAAKQGLDTSGFGLASVRFICGTQDGHTQLALALEGFLQMCESLFY